MHIASTLLSTHDLMCIKIKYLVLYKQLQDNSIQEVSVVQPHVHVSIDFIDV